MDALSEARRALAARVIDPKVRMLGLSDDLRLILAAFDEIDRRTGVLASAFLHKHFWPGESMHEAVYASLAEMSAQARSIHRVGVHGKNCACMECSVRGLTRSEDVDNKK